MIVKKFYKTEDEFAAFHARLKLMKCPHCHLCGFLILHGYLYGYSENGPDTIRRGHRIFCSNRKNRCGCGRTFSVLASHFIKHYMISAHTLWLFLAKIHDGLSIADAFRKSGCHMVMSSAYRLFNTFRFNQPRIRSFLSRRSSPPQLQIKNPLIQTIAHIGSVFKISPASAFQYEFQSAFFEGL